MFVKSKEPLNERPDYASLDTERTRRQQRLAALYQSGIAKTRSKEPPRFITSLRDLPSIAMVHDKRTDQVLLPPDARHRMGRSRAADHDMRRQSISDIGTLGSSRALTGIKTAINSDKALAIRIQAFVAAMPAGHRANHSD
jgi:hypothetical protein